MGNNLIRGTRNEKEKMEQGFGCTFNDGDEHITSVSLWRKSEGKEGAETIQPIMKKCGKDIFEL